MLFNCFGAFGTQDLFAPDRRLFGLLAISDYTPNRSQAQSSDVKHRMNTKMLTLNWRFRFGATPRMRASASDCVVVVMMRGARAN
jgi:hypothetical protein